MARYLPQDLFEMLVASAIVFEAVSEISLEEAIAEICGNYEESYPDDREMRQEVLAAAQAFKLFILTSQEEKHLPVVMRQMQYCIKYFQPNGKKRGWRLLGGTAFNYEKQKNAKRVDEATRNLSLYHLGSLAGGFPLAPRGWTL